MAKPEAATPPPVAQQQLLCAICLHSGRTVAAVTTVNGTSLCKDDAMVAPRAAFPYAEA